MMKTATFAIALLMSGAAFAQTYGPTDVQSDVATQTEASTDPASDATHDMSGHDMTTQSMTTQGTTTQGTITPGTTAQDMTTQDTTTTQSTARWSDNTQSGTTTFAANTAPAGSAVVQPGNTDPERDARGIAVMSDAATVPAGYNGIAATAAGGPLLDPATGEAAQDGYPPCTASVTDNCLQTYERGRSPQ